MAGDDDFRAGAVGHLGQHGVQLGLGFGRELHRPGVKVQRVTLRGRRRGGQQLAHAPLHRARRGVAALHFRLGGHGQGLVSLIQPLVALARLHFHGAARLGQQGDAGGGSAGGQQRGCGQQERQQGRAGIRGNPHGRVSTMKSVPRTPMTAVGVVTLTFSG